MRVRINLHTIGSIRFVIDGSFFHEADSVVVWYFWLHSQSSVCVVHRPRRQCCRWAPAVAAAAAAAAAASAWNSSVWVYFRSLRRSRLGRCCLQVLNAFPVSFFLCLRSTYRSSHGICRYLSCWPVATGNATLPTFLPTERRAHATAILAGQVKMMAAMLMCVVQFFWSRSLRSKCVHMVSRRNMFWPLLPFLHLRRQRELQLWWFNPRH